MSTPKTAFPDATRGTIFTADPKSPEKDGFVKFVGYDRNKDGSLDDESHILYSVTKRNTTINPQMYASIKSSGVIQPVIVRKNGPYAEIVVGRRRVIHLRAVNEALVAEGKEPKLLQMVKFEGSDAELLELMMTENIDREDESDEELARLAKRLLLHKSREYVAERCHCSVASLAQLLQVLDLDPLIRANTGRGKFFSRDAAVAMVHETFERQREIFKELREEKGLEYHEPERPTLTASTEVVIPEPEATTVASAGADEAKPKSKGKKATPRATRGDVEGKVAPDKAQKLKKSEIERVIAMLDADADKPKAERYFQIDDPAAFARDLLRCALGEVKATKIKGLSAVVSGKKEPSEE